MTAVKNFIRKICAYIFSVIPILKKIVPVNIQVKLGVKLTAPEYKQYTLHGIYPALYKKYAVKPVDENKVIIIVVRHTNITNSFQLLFDRLCRDYDFDVHVHFLRDPFAKRTESIRRCSEMIADVATAKYVFIDDGSNVLASLPIRKETSVTQLWHGCGAFKKFGFSTAELLFGNTREEMLEYPNHYMYDNVTVSSPEVVWAYEEAFGMEEKKGAVKALGCSRTDIFYDKGFIADAKKKLERIMPSSVGKKVILYAPTFRGRVKKATAPDLLDVAQFAKNLSDEYVLIFKHHPLVKKNPEIPQLYSDFARDFTDAMSIEELICVSDICISDYSSLIFEYSLFEKPMIFFAYDLSEYFDWRGFYYDYDELAPGPIFKSNRDMIDYIKNIDTRFDREKVRAFRQKFMSSCDGHATDRLLDTVFGDELKKHLNPENRRFEIEYHLVPTSKLLPSQNRELINDLIAQKENVRRLYTAECRKPVDKNKIVFINSGSSAGVCRLVDMLKNNPDLSVVTVDAKANDEDIVKEIATARFIILDSRSVVTDYVALRSESEIIQLWKYSVPVKRLSYSSISYESGLKKDYYKALSEHKNYGYVPVCSDYAAQAFAKVFGCGFDVIRKTGSVHTDVFFDEERKAEALEKINTVFPASRDKKIIFYCPDKRKDITVKPNVLAFLDIQKLYEALKNEYVVIIDYPIKGAQKIKGISYYDDFIYNIRQFGINDSESDNDNENDDEETTESEDTGLMAGDVMAVSDIVIGDYNSKILEFAVTGKPLMFYAPDATTIYSVNHALTDYYKLTDGIRFNDTDSLISQIENLDSYDYTHLAQIKAEFFGECDGKAGERILQYILSGAAESKEVTLVQ